MVYRAARDPRVTAPRAAAAILVVLAGALQVIASAAFGPMRLAVMITGLAVFAIGFWLVASVLFVRYEMTDFELVVQTGFRFRRIPLECIEGVLPVLRPSEDPLLRPPHITVVCQKGGRAGAAVVMPEDAETFLKDLAAGAPFLEKVGDRLLRKPGLLTTQ